MPHPHVVSQELAEELRKLGWPQESLYRHVAFLDYGNGQRLWSPKGWYLVSKDDQMFWRPRVEEHWCAAPLASEMLDQMPEYIYVQKRRKTWYCCLQDSELDTIPTETASTLPDALAKLAINLIKEGIIKF